MSAKTANMVLTVAMKAAKKTRSTPRQWSRKRHGERGARSLVGLGLGLELGRLLEPAADDQPGHDDDRR